MSDGWDANDLGVVVFPSGRRIRGRGLRAALGDSPLPDFGLYLLGHEPEPTPWPSRWIRWPDFRLPSDHRAACDALLDIWTRSIDERVEVACHGGRGRTGTALACLAVLDGVPADAAVAYIRQHYHRRAVETPWQRRYVARFRAP